MADNFFDDLTKNLTKGLETLKKQVVEIYEQGTTASEVKNGLQAGKDFYKKGMIKDAIEEYLTVLEINPDVAEAYIELAKIYCDIEDKLDDALEMCDKYEDLHPKGNPTISIAKGIVYYRKNNFDDAIKEFQKLIDDKVKNIKIYKYMGEIYLSKEKYDAAESYYYDAMQLDPSILEYHNKLIQCYLKQDKKSDALLQARILYMLDKKSSENIDLLTKVYLANGMKEEADALTKEIADKKE